MRSRIIKSPGLSNAPFSDVGWRVIEETLRKHQKLVTGLTEIMQIADRNAKIQLSVNNNDGARAWAVMAEKSKELLK
jgi:hypothetical protein